jgi:hypothetical protein
VKFKPNEAAAQAVKLLTNSNNHDALLCKFYAAGSASGSVPTTAVPAPAKKLQSILSSID